MIKSLSKITKEDHFEIFLLILSLFLLACYYMGFFPALRGDAVRYAAIGQEMFHNHNFLELQNRGGVPYIQKPPLLFWIITASYKVFGINHFAFKMPIFLITLVGIYATYKNALLHYDKKVGQLAAIFLITSFGFIFYHNDIHTDSVILATIALSVWQLNLFLRDGRFVNLLLGFFFVGMSMMTKGPIGLAIPVFAFGVDVLLKRQWRHIFRWEWLVGIVVIAITISPALIGLYKQFGNEGLMFYFWSNHTDRITGAMRVNNTDYFFYVHTLLWEYLPWSLFLLFGFFQEVRKIVKQKFKLLAMQEAVNIGGIIIFFIIISVSKFKGPNYIIPLFPFFAVIAANWTLRLYEGFHAGTLKYLSIIQYVVLVGIWYIVGYVTVNNFSDIPTLLSASLVALLLVFLIGFFILKENMQKMLVTASATIIAFGLLFNTFIIPITFDYHAMHQACEIVNAQSDSSTHFVYLSDEHDMVSDDTFNFYLKPLATYAQSIDDVEVLESGWVFIKKEDYYLLKDSNVKFSEEIKLSHTKRISPTFLNPTTREQGLKYFYLLKF